MVGIFTEHVFPKYTSEEAVKPQMNGFGDPSLRDFALLDWSALVKPELKGEKFEDEFIKSFLNAAKELALAGKRAINRPGMYVFYEHSYALPVLFLARHCMELAIKRAIRRCGSEPKKIHGLQELWNSLVSRFPEQRSREDRRALTNMGAFVKTIADIDNNGVSLRYPKDKAGNFTQDRPLFVNDELIANTLEKFVKQLGLIDFGALTDGDR